LVAAAATLLLLRACERPGWLRWLGYGLTMAVLGWLHVVALLLLAGHAWTVLSWRRRAWWPFVATASAAGLASAPILILGAGQRHQIAYIPPVGFDTAIGYGQVIFGGLVLAAAIAVLALFSLPLRFPSAVLTGWAVVPVVALVLVSQAMPMFLPRYLIFTTPAWALLAGVALVRWRIPLLLLGIVGLTLLALPAQLPQRTAGGHSQATNQIAVVLRGNEKPGDAIAYADDEPVGSWTARDAVAHYVPAAQRPQDVLAITPQRHNGQLLATECPDPAPCLDGVQRLWVLRMGTLDDPLSGIGVDKEPLLRQQFQVVRIWYPAGITLALLQRVQPEA
jgi:mannosyltransferase